MRSLEGHRGAFLHAARIELLPSHTIYEAPLPRDRLELLLIGERVFLGEDQFLLEDVRCTDDGIADRVSDRVSVRASRRVSYRVEFRLGRRVSALVTRTSEAVYVMSGGSTERFLLPKLDVSELASAAGAGERIVSPMPGQVISVLVAVGDSVEAGQPLLVVEAMKMEHGVSAPRAGTVARLSCAVGDRVEDGVELVALED